MEFHLHSLVLSAGLTQAFSIHNVSQRDTVKESEGLKKGKGCLYVNVNLRVIQQQDNGVEFFPGSVIGSERHYKVIKTVSCSLSRHNDELVFKTVSFCIFEAVVPATL